MEDKGASKQEVEIKEVEIKEVNPVLFTLGVEKDKDYYFNSYAHYSELTTSSPI